MKAWVDGALVDLAQARVSVLDHGLVVGDGVFETLRVYGGVPFAWTRHLERLRVSADGLGLEPPDRAICVPQPTRSSPRTRSPRRGCASP